MKLMTDTMTDHSRLRVLAALTAIACLFAAWWAHAADAPSSSAAAVTGAWHGVLGPEKGGLRIVLTVRQMESGEYVADVESVDQGAQFPADSITVKDRALKFEIKAIGGVYQGALDDSGTTIAGTWQQTGAPVQPLSFKRGADTDAGKAATATPATAPGPKEKPFTVPLELLVPVAPAPFNAGGKTHLAYELRLINSGPWNSVISGLEVIATDDGRKLASFTQADIERMIDRRAAPKSQLAPQTAALLYVWVTLDGQAAPAKLVNRLQVKLGDYPEMLTLETRPIVVGAAAPVIGAPLRGDRWLAANGPSNASPHRRARIPVDGHAAIAQRYAIDWVRLGKDGKTFRGDPLKNENYHANGADALAVADGVVAAVHDGIPQNVPGLDSRAVPITLETVGGNYVILDIGEGRYAFYAHLIPGSLRVKVGDKVRRGQVVGLVGNTGNSTEPHLHFHISDGPSPLGSEGLPYALAAFEVQAHSEGKTDKTPPQKRTLAIPAQDELVRFDESAR